MESIAENQASGLSLAEEDGAIAEHKPQDRDFARSNSQPGGEVLR